MIKKEKIISLCLYKSRAIKLMLLAIRMALSVYFGFGKVRKQNLLLYNNTPIRTLFYERIRMYARPAFVGSKCIIVSYRTYRPIGTSLDGMVAFFWLCERMKVDIKIESPTRMIWRHFDNDTIVNTTGNEKRKLEFAEQRFFYNNMAWVGRFFISSEYGYKVMSKLSIKESLRQCAAEWFNEHIKGNWVAVHYRGTDIEKLKKRDHKSRYRIELDNYIIYLKEVLDNQSSIFVCSDQQQFVDKMHEVFPGRVFARNITRSDGTIPIHLHCVPHESIDNYKQEKDAFIDLLILTKAKLIYTTGSSFVDAARYFNPQIKIVSLDGRSIGRGKNNVPIPRKELYNKLRID